MQQNQPQSANLSGCVFAKELHWNLMVFFLNGNSVTKIFVVTVKGLEPDTSCVIEQDVNAVPVRHL